MTNILCRPPVSFKYIIALIFLSNLLFWITNLCGGWTSWSILTRRTIEVYENPTICVRMHQNIWYERLPQTFKNNEVICYFLYIFISIYHGKFFKRRFLHLYIKNIPIQFLLLIVRGNTDVLFWW